MGVAAACNLLTAVPRSLAVIRPGDRDLAERFTALGLRLVENPEADRGMGTSLAAGVSAAADAAGWLVALADMPWIQPQIIRALAAELRHGASLVALMHQGAAAIRWVLLGNGSAGFRP